MLTLCELPMHCYRWRWIVDPTSSVAMHWHCKVCCVWLIQCNLYKYIPALDIAKGYSNLRRSGCILNYELPDRRRCQICRCTADWLLTHGCPTPADICWYPQHPVVFPLAHLTSPLYILLCPNLTNMINSSQWNLCIKFFICKNLGIFAAICSKCMFVSLAMIAGCVLFFHEMNMGRG